MSTTQKQRAGAGRASTGTDATGVVHSEAQVSFTAKLVILGEASGADLSDYAGEPVLIFVADPEEVRKAAPLFNRPVALATGHNAALEAMQLRAMLLRADRDALATAARAAVDFCCGNRGHKNFGDHCSQCEPLVRALHAFKAP